MIVSLNEIETLARKAAAGAGLPVGVADDFGAAVRALAEAGAPAERLAAKALGSLDAGAVRPAPRRDGAVWRLAPSSDAALSAAASAPTAADLACAFCSDPDGGVVLEAVDVPEIVIGALAASGGDFTVEYGGRQLRVSGGEIGPLSGAPGADTPVAMAIRSGAGAGDGLRRTVPTEGVPADRTAWEALERYAARCLVPESEGSRLRGAGAGLLDAD